MDDSNTSDNLYDIAIIGMTGRFPGSRTLEEFWRNLCEGRELISFFTDEELEASGIDPTVLQDPAYVKAGAILEDADLFDASFFGFFPKEAEIMDPQQRIFLEGAWEALEGAGYNPESYKGRIGVYAGESINSYLLNNIGSNYDLIQSLNGMQTFIGNDRDFLTTQVSYKLNLKGPSITVQTACSTSLVAVHLACQSLLSRECDMALAGGVSVAAPLKSGYFYEEGGISSPDGHCRAFDARAQGTVGGNGLGIVVLKRLADALADGDFIHALIKGSAVNNDGSLKVGYTAPSVDGQAEVIAEALAVAGVDCETISYIETHGTGTPVGDPIEIFALKQAFSSAKGKKSFCALGSVKTNMGHLDAAAGVAGLIKTVLSLEHKMLPPSLHFEQPNPLIDFDDSPFYVNSKLAQWEESATARRAGVSSFGIGGTNAHAVLEEAPARKPSGESRSSQLLLLSAKTSSALDKATQNLAEHLKQNSDLNLADVAYTLQVGRATFGHRLMLVCHDLNDAVAGLERPDSNRACINYQELRDRQVAFMFPGQGAQHTNMGLELYREEPSFREHVNNCSELLLPHLGLDLRSVLYPAEGQAEEASKLIDQTYITQPALFVIEYALARLWMKWGIRPQAMIGHSIGEYVAACLAGVFSLEDALRLVAMRGRLMQNLPAGVMLAVPLPEKQLRSMLAQDLSLAAINGPAMCVVSGAAEAIEKMERILSEQGVGCRRLHTSHAFHSKMMDPILEQFAVEVKKAALNSPQTPYISNVTGTWVKSADATNAAYWAAHLRQEVRFGDGIAELVKEPTRILLEVGPGRTLNKLAKGQIGKSDSISVFASLRRPDEDAHSDTACLLNTLGHLWLEGGAVDWAGFYAYEERQRLPLPTYPFERKRYWIEADVTTAPRSPQASLRRKADIGDWFYMPAWRQSKSPEQFGTLYAEDQESPWLVFLDGCGLGAQLIERLKQNGHPFITVKAGDSYGRISDREYTLHPLQKDGYDSLLKELRTLNKIPRTILHLWNVTTDARAWPDVIAEGEGERASFYSLLFLAQAIGEQDLSGTIEIGVVSNNLQDVTGEEELSPGKSVLLGPCRVIPQEYANIKCRSIDVIVPEPGTGQQERLVDQLLAEMSTDSAEAIIAYRRNHRWVQTFEAMRLEGETTSPARLRQRGIYLITGGLSNLGLEVAEFLAKKVRARLVLADHTGLIERELWDQWLATNDEQDSTSQLIRRMLLFEELGAELLIIKADTSSPALMKDVIDRAHKRFGAIHGVVHTERVQGQGLIQLKTVEMADDVLAPKVKGTLLLASLLKDVKLDFMILYSTTTSILGGFGLVDYCAANAFLDSFAHFNSSRRGVYTVSIDWGMWQWDDFQESLMAGAPEAQADLKEAREKYGISLQESIEALSRIMFHSLPQVVVSTQDFNAIIEQNKSITASSFMEQFNLMRQSDLAQPRPDLSSTYVAPSNDIERTIIDILRELFGIEGIGVNDDFFDLGGNSLVGISFISRLRKTFNVEVSISLLFEAPTVARMASVIAESQLKEEDIDEISRLLSEIENLSLDEIEAQLAAEPQLMKEDEVNG